MPIRRHVALTSRGIRPKNRLAAAVSPHLHYLLLDGARIARESGFG